MRTIHLREADPGLWTVSVTLRPYVVHSVQPALSRAQALRSFIIEGRHQPYARMLVHLPGHDKPTLVRQGRHPRLAEVAGSVDLAAVRAALRQPRLRLPRWRGTTRARAKPGAELLASKNPP